MVRNEVTPKTISFQKLCWEWVREVFGVNTTKYLEATSVEERARRFLEEAIELVQASGLPKEDVLKLVDYTYSRPAGQEWQEVGGVMVTLAIYCEAMNINMDVAGNEELIRVNTPEMIDRIRQKQVTKLLAGIGGVDVTQA